MINTNNAAEVGRRISSSSSVPGNEGYSGVGFGECDHKPNRMNLNPAKRMSCRAENRSQKGFLMINYRWILKFLSV